MIPLLGFPSIYPDNNDVSGGNTGSYQFVGGEVFPIRGTFTTYTPTIPSGYSDPGESNVKTGITYDFDSSVKTGTYTGSDRWTDPGIANVRSGTSYKANSTSNNRTGTLDLPSDSDVKTGVVFDNSGSTGTYTGSDRWTDPGIANVRSGTSYKANSTSNNRTGNITIPSTSEVKIGTTFDTLNSSTGIYDGSDRWSSISEANVLTGLNYKDNSLTNNKTGSLLIPTASENADAIWDKDISAATNMSTPSGIIKRIRDFLKKYGF